jgi:SAM-dependent methyltransferase
MDSVKYYNENASKYIADTFEADMSNIRNKFTALLPVNGKILDAGCGSGRDLKAFKELGFEVYGIDASEVFVEHCKSIIDAKIELSTFQDYTTDTKFDGIWACATLLHVRPEELSDVLSKFFGFLKNDGVFFMSFKYGVYDYVKDGRYFNCYTTESIIELLNAFDGVEILENFVTSDVREGRADEKWVNVIVKNKVVNG